VPSKGGLKVFPKIAVAVPPKRVLDRKFLRWEKNKQRELELLSMRALAAFQMPMNGLGKVNPHDWTNVDDKIRRTVMDRQAP